MVDFMGDVCHALPMFSGSATDRILQRLLDKHQKLLYFSPCGSLVHPDGLGFTVCGQEPHVVALGQNSSVFHSPLGN